MKSINVEIVDNGNYVINNTRGLVEVFVKDKWKLVDIPIK